MNVVYKKLDKKNLKLSATIFVIITVFISLLYSFCASETASALKRIPISFKNTGYSVNLPNHKNGYHPSNGATLAGGYLLYTNDEGGDESNRIQHIFRCKWPLMFKTSTCQDLTKGKYRHANALDSQNGSSYFWVLNGMNGDIGLRNNNSWCLDSISGKEVSRSKCGGAPKIFNNRKSFGCGLLQDFAQYGNYELRLYNGCGNKIEVKKNGKSIALLNSSKGTEFEGLFADPETGRIYLTDPAGSRLNIYEVKGYSLPAQPVFTSAIGESMQGKGSAPGSSTSTDSTATPTRPAYDGTVGTVLFGTIKDNGKGCGVFMILNVIVEILTYGIGILGVLGISIVGIQYLTARGNEEQTNKARRRLFEIIIGIAAYVLLWSFINWLMPGGKLNSSTTCTTATTTSCQVADSSDH